MKLNKLVMGIAAVGMFSAFAAPSQATVLDAWQATINGNTYTNIGRLSLTGGSGTVEQEVNAFGQVFTNARFVESASIYNISFVSDNVVGPTDNGPIVVLNSTDFLSINLSSVKGKVSTIGPAGFAFNFNSGAFSINLLNSPFTPQATGKVSGIGGTFNNTAGFAGGNGETVQDVLFTSLLNGFNLKDSTGKVLDINKIAFEAHTNNQVGNGPGDAVLGTCSFDTLALCVTVKVNSNGDGFLTTTVPEPATLALMGMGLLGMGFSTRRKSK